MIDNRATKNFLKNEYSPIKRNHIINNIIQKYNFKSYLEIGIFDGSNFMSINCEHKHAVDPGHEGILADCVTHPVTSNEFFKNSQNTYDVIFIDGLHHYKQVIEDINNSIKHTSPGGYIILHDCNPIDKLAQEIPRKTVCWNGDVWKAFVLFRKYNPNSTSYVIDTDFGVGVIKNQDLIPILSTNIEITWEEFEENKKQLLNLVDMNHQI